MRCRLWTMVVVASLVAVPSYAELGQKGDLDIVMLDVGQGDCFFLELPNGCKVLVDGGPYGGKTTLPLQLWAFLKETYAQELNGPEKRILIDAAVLTHSDSDHLCGIMSLLWSPKVRIKRLYHNWIAPLSQANSWEGNFNPHLKGVVAMSKTQLGGYNGPFAKLLAGVKEEATRGMTTFDRLGVGDEELLAALEGDGAGISVLNPLEHTRNYDNDRGKVINANSVAFRLTWRHFEALFTGDLNHYSEAELWQSHKDDGLLECDLLKVPHHGSNDRDSNFLLATRPLVSFISAGCRPLDYDHPKPEALLDILNAYRRRLGQADTKTEPSEEQLVPNHIFVTRYLEENVALWTDGHELTVKVGGAGYPAVKAELD